MTLADASHVWQGFVGRVPTGACEAVEERDIGQGGRGRWWGGDHPLSPRMVDVISLAESPARIR